MIWGAQRFGWTEQQTRNDNSYRFLCRLADETVPADDVVVYE